MSSIGWDRVGGGCRHRAGMTMAAALMLSACGYPYTPPALPSVVAAPAAAAVEQRQPVTILISIDGFRPDYLDRGVTPVLSRLAANGARAAMRPSFPSKTFPNHWTLVTGKVPDHNGVVANSMEDPRRPGEVFTMASDDPFWWAEAEPVWVTAEKAGIRTGTVFWPGANVPWGGTKASAWPYEISGGTRPQDWQQFNQAVANRQRVDTAIDWLRRPAAERPRFLTLYFDTVDTAGHQFGPDDPRTTAAVAAIDADIGRLVDRLAGLGQPANLVIVADHGMAATASARTVALDSLLPPGSYRTIDAGAFASIVPTPGSEAEVAAALLKPQPHMQCWRKADIPVRFNYGRNPRVAPLVCLAEVGWVIQPKAPTASFAGGNHGYDNAAPEMRALFIASGPAFRSGVRLGDFDNTSVAPLLRRLLGLPAGTGLDGDTTAFGKALR